MGSNKSARHMFAEDAYNEGKNKHIAHCTECFWQKRPLIISSLILKEQNLKE